MLMSSFPLPPSVLHPVILIMTISQLLLFVHVVFCLQPPLSPLPPSLIYGQDEQDPLPSEHLCENHYPQNVQELIRTSPVILKALGARIFADSVTADDELITSGRSGRSSSSSSSNQRITPTTTTATATSSPLLSLTSLSSSSSSALVSSTTSSETTLITLTPETLFKGASVLKFARIADVGEYYEYEGQLNATVDPLGECIDGRLLNLLPAQLIVFGKLETGQPDLLKLTVNGLYKWSPEFERSIWKYLGWDDWSDFTLCSVTCGKGVQQRFRRCLLDTSLSSSVSSSNRDSNDGGDGGGLGGVNDGGDNRNGDRILSPPRDYFPPRLKINEKNNNRSSKKYTTANKMKKRKRRKGKGLSTLSCEGYNIEQRNCNMFECKDDISDLLKFYKKFYFLNETSTGTTIASAPLDLSMSSTFSAGAITTTTTTTTNGGSGGSGISGAGFQRSWTNSVNFTIMITLRAKNQSQAATIVSLRNSSHNLYLEQSQDGIKLFQERDDVTEMLPIKFDLYDNRWHQIAISVHNGDFITVYVDCLWTNSFVVSKRLFALPDGADVEVGRGFNGDLQQLLIIPGNHEKLQCSTVRTSINEVKRYIIDTFIDDDN